MNSDIVACKKYSNIIIFSKSVYIVHDLKVDIFTNTIKLKWC